MSFNEIFNNLDHWKKLILSSTSFQELTKTKTDLLGKKGLITSAFKSMQSLSVDEKKEFGAKNNEIKEEVESDFSEQQKKLEDYKIASKLRTELIDVTLPSNLHIGSKHLITQTIKRIKSFYQARGFDVIDGPELETEFYNFDALNIPEHHPARQSQDTFYVKNQAGRLLRTQTSSVQIHTLQTIQGPVRMISLGKTYRNDQLDATHSPMFHQMEGLVVEEKPLSIGHLKNELKKFIGYFFDVDDVSIRFRPSFFPFTEPSMEFDCRYKKVNGNVVLHKDGDKWLELGGAGMVHPNVFKNCGIDKKLYGFAWGIGVDRITMLKYGVSDIRNLFDTDNRFLKHYK